MTTEVMSRCSECGGTVKFLAKTGRMREFFRCGKFVVLPVPKEFKIPTCIKCGEEFMIPEVSELLNSILEKIFIEMQYESYISYLFDKVKK